MAGEDACHTFIGAELARRGVGGVLQGSEADAARDAGTRPKIATQRAFAFGVDGFCSS